MADLNKIVDDLSALTVLEAAELSKLLLSLLRHRLLAALLLRLLKSRPNSTSS